MSEPKRLTEEELEKEFALFGQRGIRFLRGHIAALDHELATVRAELAEARRCQNFGYEECVKHLEELAACKAERDEAKRNADRWLAFHNDCTCGAAVLHRTNGTVLKGQAYAVALQRDEASALAQRYREALEWYADGLTWLESFNSACAARSDRGAKARQALEGGEK